MLITSLSDNENFSADSLENINVGGVDVEKKRKFKKLLPKRRRKTYLELYQSRLAVEFLNHRENGNMNEVRKVASNENSNNDEKQREVQMKTKKRSCRWSEYLARQQKQQCSLSQTNSKSEMLKRRTEYGCRMSSMNRVNRLCKDLHKQKKTRQRHNSSSSQSLSNNDNESNENASTSKTARVNEKQRKNSKETTCELEARSGALQMRLLQMQIRHRIDRRKAEKIQNSLMSKMNLLLE